MLCLIDQAVKLRDSALIIAVLHESDPVFLPRLHLLCHMTAAGKEKKHASDEKS